MWTRAMSLAALCAAMSPRADAAEVWLDLDASSGGDHLSVQVPWSWVDDAIITDALRAELEAATWELEAQANLAGVLSPGEAVLVRTTPRRGERIDVSLEAREQTLRRARGVRIEHWQGGGDPEVWELSFFAARAALPVLESVEIDGEPLLGAAQEMLDLDRALLAARDHPPTVLLDSSEGGQRIRVSTW